MDRHSVDPGNLPQPSEEREAGSSAAAELPNSGIDVSASAPDTATSDADTTSAPSPDVVDVGLKFDASAHKNPLHTS